MAHIRGILVTLATDTASESNTDNQLYIGIWGTDGGREFPIASKFFDDNFATGTTQIFSVGTLLSTPVGSLPSDRAGPGEANDPALLHIDLSSVQYVYLRKQATGSGKDDDDAYRLRRIAVDLFGESATPDRRFALDTRGLWFGNEHGHQAWLREVR